MPRPRKLRPISVTPFLSADGVWRAFLPKLDDYGRPILNAAGQQRRWKREADTLAAVEQKIRELEDAQAERISLRAASVATRPTSVTYRLHAWLTYWRDDILPSRLDYNALRDYRWAVDALILPNIEDVLLHELETRHIEEMLKRVRLRGSHDAPNRAYRRLRTALNDAIRRAGETGLIYNPIKAITEPAVPRLKVEPLDMDEVRLVLKSAQTRRNATRWTVALALGLRQGEALALRWTDVNLDQGVLWVSESLYRRRWLHGCSDPHACGVKYHKVRCLGRGEKHDRYHRAGCPEVRNPCVDGCTKHAVQCEHRHGGVDRNGVQQDGGQIRKAPKSEAGRRPVPIPPVMVPELRAHQLAQEAEKRAALDRWVPTGAVFATTRGKTINERTDSAEWHAILKLSGVAAARLHDARHTAATLMLLQKIQPAVVMAIMGWSDDKMLRRYQHIVGEMLVKAGDAIGALFSEGSATDHDTDNVIQLKQVRAKTP